MKLKQFAGVVLSVTAFALARAGETTSLPLSEKVAESLAMASERVSERIKSALFLPIGYKHHLDGSWVEHRIPVESAHASPNYWEVHTDRMRSELATMYAMGSISEYIMVYGGQGVVKVLIQTKAGAPREFSAKCEGAEDFAKLRASLLQPGVSPVAKWTEVTSAKR